MANIWTLTDGTTTISLNTGTVAWVQAHRMGTPDVDTDRVTDSLDLLVVGASLTAVTTNVRALEAMLEAARRRAFRQTGPRIYLTVQWDGQSDAWRAELYDYALDADATAGQLWRKAAVVSLALTRGPFEGDWAQLTLTNGNGTNNTAGLTVWNTDEATAGVDNYADIDAAEVGGSLPAPVKFELKNATGGALGWGEWWVGASTALTLSHIIEGEGRVSGYGTITANAASSNANYNAQTVNGTLQTQWDITAARAQAFGGAAWRVLARFAGAVPDAWVQPAVYDSTGLVELGTGDKVQLTSSMARLVDLGVLTIPPGDAATAFGALRIVLKWSSTSSQSIPLDALHFLPAATTRQLIQRGLQIANGESLVLDESETRAHFTAGSEEVSVYVLRGQPVLLTPGKAHRLLVLASRLTGSVVRDDKWTLRAWVRPRRWTV